MKSNKIFDFSRKGFQDIINIMTKKINEVIDLSNGMIPRLDDYISKIDWNKIINSDLYQRVLGDLGKTNEQLETKANEVDLEVERNRINNIVAQPPTVDNVETTDIRVGVDGVTYSSAGQAVRTQVGNINNSIGNLSVLPTLFNFKYKGLFENLTFTSNKNINMTDISDMTINNYLEHTIDSSVGNVSNVIRIKLDNGVPIFNNWNWQNLSSTAVFIHYFNKSGNYLTSKNFNSPTVNEVPDEAYFALFVKYNNINGVNTYLDDINVEWLNNTVEKDVKIIKEEMKSFKPTKEYYVGNFSGADYSGLIDCLVSLKADTDKKTIYIADGIYNIFEEIGGSAFAKNITDSQTWQEVSVFVPENTTIIGIGNVVLNFLPEANETTPIASTRLSPINIRGNVRLENLKIYAKNCRYCIHDEVGTDVNFYNKTHELINVECYYLKSDYNAGAGGQAYANGFQSGMKYIFKNCIFDGKARNPAFSMHNNNDTAVSSSTIIIDNCIFNAPSGQPDIAFYNSLVKQMYNTVKISNSYLSNKKLQLGKNWTGTSMKNAFDITMNNCNNVTIEDLLENNIFTPKIYNVIAN